MCLEDRVEFESDLRVIEAEVQAGITENYSKRKDSHGKVWETYCHKIHVNPFLLDVKDHVPILKIFQTRLRKGRIAPCG